MKNLNKVLFIWILVGLSVLVWIGSALLGSVPFSDWIKMVKLLPTVVTADGIFLTVFVKWFWKWRVFQGWLVPFPNLNGTWEGKIQTTWIDPKTGICPPFIAVILCIRQSFVGISCVMRTQEMTSHSYCSDFVLDTESQIKRLAYSYRSSPRPTVVVRSAPHDGSVVFDVIGQPVKKLKGEYWTSRKTTGEIILTFRCKECLEEFPDDLGKHPVSGAAGQIMPTEEPIPEKIR